MNNEHTSCSRSRECTGGTYRRCYSRRGSPCRPASCRRRGSPSSRHGRKVWGLTMFRGESTIQREDGYSLHTYSSFCIVLFILNEVSSNSNIASMSAFLLWSFVIFSWGREKEVAKRQPRRTRDRRTVFIEDMVTVSRTTFSPGENTLLLQLLRTCDQYL